MSRISAPLSLALVAVLAAAPLVSTAAVAVAAQASHSAVAADGDVVWSVEPIQTAGGVRRTFEYSVDPGTQIVDSMVITNSGTTSAEFLIYATDAINELETGAFGLLERDTTPTDVGSWITTNSDKLTIDPGMQAIVPFNLLVPSDATPGEHVAGLIASVITSGENDGAAVQLEQRVAARLYLTVSGAIDAGVEIEGLGSGFNPQLNPFAAGDLDIDYTVHNSGNVRLEVAQAIRVTGPFGIELGRFEPEPIMELLPRQSVHVETNIPAVLALFLSFSEVTLTPGVVGGAAAAQAAEESTEEPAASASPSAEAETFVDATGVDYETASETSFALAISWTLLVLVLIVAALIYLTVRYVSSTRERMYLAIDEAAAAAREEASAQNRDTEKAGV
jgi:hypothetical protein